WNGTPYSTGNNNGYRDFTESIITVSENRIINYQLEAGFAGNYVLTENWMIYADWNKDGDFEDEGENVLKASSAIPLTASFIIPQQVKGKIRIRVIMTDAGNTKSCGKYAFGETEDYMLEIEEVQLKKSIPATAAGFTLYPVPADQYFFIQSTTGSKIKELVIRNFLGQVIHRESITNELVKLNCSHLVAGNYVVTIYTDKRETYQSKITIAH
ncbi:MAG: T9SS type A sorting domain-containing protein, partial [Saprospiraceae bacterium]|nr:T9SS type A sorting domain-containing protein [Saprospiraceae bacterium]